MRKAPRPVSLEDVPDPDGMSRRVGILAWLGSLAPPGHQRSRGLPTQIARLCRAFLPERERLGAVQIGGYLRCPDKDELHSVREASSTATSRCARASIAYGPRRRIEY